jgi:phosphoadenosine phosphosulfate reductase
MKPTKALLWKIAASKKVIISSLKKYQSKLALAWTGGKDSTVLLDLVRSIQKDKLNIPAVYIDTGLDFEEVSEFIEKVKKDWKIRLIRITDKPGLKKFNREKNKAKRKEMARIMKIRGIEKAVKQYKLKALMVGIRWDEHVARSTEVYFSARDDHMRVHPILHFTEKDIWDYIKYRKVPYNPLYDKGYRSLGEKEFTKPVINSNLPERAGREKDKEKIMERLRALGYF